MLITSLTIENFKGIREPVRIEFRPITLLFGPNSSGKSTILQALHYAREIFERENADPGRTLTGGTSVDLGGFHNIVPDHDVSRALVLRFDLDLSNEDLPDYRSEFWRDDPAAVFYRWDGLTRLQSAWVQIEVRWDKLMERPMIGIYEVGLNSELLGRITASEGGKQIFLSYMNFLHPLFMNGENEDQEQQVSLMASMWDSLFQIETIVDGSTVSLPVAEQRTALPRWGRPLSFPEGAIKSPLWMDKPSGPINVSEWTEEQVVGILSALMVGPGELIRDALFRMKYLGPLREIPPRNYEAQRTVEESAWACGLAAWDVLHKSDPHFLEIVNEWVGSEKRLNAGYEVEVKRYKELDISSRLFLLLNQNRSLDEGEWIGEELEKIPTKSRVFLRDSVSGVEVLPQDVGVGISQVVPVVVLALSARLGIVAIEQPELHLHPALQVALGDLFINQIQDRDLVFLIETHSEHLLLRLLRRIRERHEDELPPGIDGLRQQQLAIHYFVNTDKGIAISWLEVDETGDSQGRWPKGFFEERHEELY